MCHPNPITRIMTIPDVKDALASVIDEVQRKEARVLVQHSGDSVAAIVSAEDLELLNRLDVQRARRHEVLAAMREPFRGVPPDEIERETERVIAEIHAEDRTHAASER